MAADPNGRPPMSLFTEALETFHTLLARAISEGEPEPTAMVLATADPDGRVSARTVLLKELDERGFVFFSNYQSNKGRQLTAHPRAALCFLWKTLDQQIQVKVEGEVEVLRAEESDAYFASRPRGSQIGAWASSQSQPIQDRQVLLDRVAELEARYQGRDVPRPGHWGGYRVLPEMIEFWYGRPYRLHERQRYQRIGGQWQRLLLSP